MRDRLSEPFDLAQLAGAAHLSPFHFSRMFKKSIGMSPSLIDGRCTNAR
ncbi:AraC family transcriptional regulator [Pseudoduganella albidiflava]|uniref:AraC family transcriptional regulator n=1 Tax=Pseudoduganella albidiflava TaxID=321983 RepID=A0ABX5RV43_9BURK|nr:helix-turn-helix transcriptional regulator [Pseudoduganella albidiflava]QBI02416.1 AraC family transcriptional regulator [Pseudoduganella albidiflava]